MNCAISSMGYALPAAIGACLAGGHRKVVCIEGDGSIMMNLQELQTIVTNRLPICIFVINNGGYHQIRQTQNNVFHDGLIGVGPESGDLGFPSFEKIAAAFGISYAAIRSNDELPETIDRAVHSETYILCEVFVSTEQIFEPKSATKRRTGVSSHRRLRTWRHSCRGRNCSGICIFRLCRRMKSKTL